ncbi:Detected protein of unknown function [Hibiscus syriacus]|uniref:C2H2-type domain-containing protein n=1 Tax=Hibiscus syriacus TaxID=106335 RepID=A0A6A3BHG5_HIBSY|nr:Detected protein of unknown function [Hibiscus syriacus]
MEYSFEDLRKKFVCKFCNKRFPCGKSLGGHIRTHMNNENSAETEEESADFPLNKLKRFAGLRENPRKTKRFSDSSNGSLFKEMVCKECGKGFRSMKALCGHMSCHSDKERAYHFDNGDKHKLIRDSQSDTETSTTPSRRRSKRIVQEQEEVAMCLMMLSRDSGFKKGPNSVADSSDNNLLSLEDKSSSVNVRITVKNAMKCVSNKNKLKQSAETCYSSENSDSGYFRNGPKKAESDDSVDEFRDSFESKKPKMVSGSGFKSKFKYGLRRNGKNAYYSPQKGSKYECLTCDKTFDSHRALGGHRASHKKANDCTESIHESRENSLASDSFTAPMSHTKVTKSKSLGVAKGFSSRAKLWEVIKGRISLEEVSDNRTLVIKQDSTEIPALIDLNLPAPVEEDAAGNAAGFMSWFLVMQEVLESIIAK